jgi:hypothetical protein
VLLPSDLFKSLPALFIREKIKEGKSKDSMRSNISRKG